MKDRRQYFKDYYRANKERKKAISAAYYQNNKEKADACRLRWGSGEPVGNETDTSRPGPQLRRCSCTLGDGPQTS